MDGTDQPSQILMMRGVLSSFEGAACVLTFSDCRFPPVHAIIFVQVSMAIRGASSAAAPRGDAAALAEHSCARAGMHV